MNDIHNVSPIQHDQLQHGLSTLQARRNKMRIFTVLSSVVMFSSLVGIFFNQALVYAFFDISTTVQQLHIPVSAVGVENFIGQQPDYFGRLLGWVMWLGLKILIALVGASLFVHYAKKISFFKKRMHNFGKRFLAWLISFLLLMLAGSLVQSEMNANGHQNEEYAEFVAYKQNIQQSEIYQYLQQNQLDLVVQEYLLAQTALLHQPIDKDTALAYTTKLIQAEQQQANFLAYGFKPEQLWAMQHQLYDQAVTPLAQSVQNQINTADRIAVYSRWLLVAAFAIFMVFSFIFYGLTQQFNRRLARIENRLN